MKTKKQKLKAETYRVWIDQVNQTYVDVKATSEEQARERGYAVWRKNYAYSRVTDARKV
jgi:hypothetical protein